MKPTIAFSLPATLLALACALLPPLAGAEKADSGKPMNIEADALRYDDLKQTSVFTGRVVLTKGTIVIRGERVDVRQDPEGYQYGVVTAGPGRLATYRQKREGVDEFIEGAAETIEYDGKADRIKFIKRAELRRLRGASVSDEVAGNLITYDNSNDAFTVDGGAAAGGPPGAPGGRVRAILAPRDAAPAPAAAASAPGASPTPAPRLRSSTSMGGGTN